MLKAIVFDEHAERPPALRQSFTVRAGPRPLSELLTLAAAAARSGTCVSFADVRARPLEDLVRIAAAGGDAVSFGHDGHPVLDDDEAAGEPSPHRLRRLLSRLSVL